MSGNRKMLLAALGVVAVTNTVLATDEFCRMEQLVKQGLEQLPCPEPLAAGDVEHY